MRNIWNNCLPRIIAFPRIIVPFWCEKRNSCPQLWFKEIQYVRESNFSLKWQPCSVDTLMLPLVKSAAWAFLTNQKEVWWQCNTLTIFIMTGWGFCDIWNNQGQGNIINQGWHIVTLSRPWLTQDIPKTESSDCVIVHCFKSCTEHSFTLFLEIVHWACDLQISQLLLADN